MGIDRFYDQLTRAVRALTRRGKPARVARLDALAGRLRAASSEGERDLVRAELAHLPRGGKPRTRRPSRAALLTAERVNAQLRRDPDPGGWRTADAEARFDEVGWPDPTGPSPRLLADAAAARQRRGGKPRRGLPKVMTARRKLNLDTTLEIERRRAGLVWAAYDQNDEELGSEEYDAGFTAAQVAADINGTLGLAPPLAVKTVAAMINRLYIHGYDARGGKPRSVPRLRGTARCQRCGATWSTSALRFTRGNLFTGPAGAAGPPAPVGRCPTCDGPCVKTRRGGKLRFDPAQLKKGIAEELEHAATIKKIIKRKLPVRKAAELIAKDHLKTQPQHYDRAEAVAVPKRAKGLKAPRLKLLRRHKKLRVYIVDSNATRKIYGDFTGGGHTLVYPDFVGPDEIWLAEELFGIERDLYLLHEANEMGLMRGGMDYDTAHDKSTALEQSFRKGKRKGLKAAITAALRRAAG